MEAPDLNGASRRELADLIAGIARRRPTGRRPLH
jgi:hypothetical protein